MASVNKILTISIPTYNRKNQLLRLLHSIEQQKCLDLYCIQISDNCSDYNLSEAICAEFSADFTSNIEIFYRPFNGGADYNITSTFLNVKTELMWLIGDDDEVQEGAIRIIVDKYQKNPGIGFFKYSMNAKHPQSEDILLNSISDIVKCHRNGIMYGGDLIFMSNNVYNLKITKKYFGDCLYYSYCSAAHTLPLLRVLIAEDECAMLCKELVVKYNAPDGDHWNYTKIVASLGSFLDISYNNKHHEIRDYFQIMCSHFGVGQFLLGILKIKDKSYRDYLYRKSRNSVFSGDIGFIGYLTCYLYRIESFTGIKILSSGYARLYNAQNNFKERMKNKAVTDPNAARCVAWMKKYMPKLK